MKTSLLKVAILGAIIAGLAGCGSSSEETTTPAAGAGNTTGNAAAGNAMGAPATNSTGG